MQSNPKTVAVFLIILGFIFAFSPIIAINNSFLTRNNSEFSEISDNEGTDQTDPYDMEGLATSSVPVVPVWSYDTSRGNRDIAISSNGQYIAVACGNFNFFEKDNSTPLWSSNLGENVITVAITPDGQYIVAGTTGDHVCFFDKNSSTPLWNYSTSGVVLSLAISLDGQYFAAAIGSRDPSVYLFERNSSTPLWRYDIGHAGRVNSVGISSDGNYIVAGAYNGNLYFFGKNSSTPIWTYQTPNWAYHVAISSDGNYIVVGTTGDTSSIHGIYFFERNNSTPIWSYITGDPVWSVAMSSDGQYIVVGTGYTGHQVYFFEKNNSTPLWSYNAGNDIQSVAITPNGQFIVAGGNDEEVYLFSKNSSTPFWTYTVLNNIASVAISSDGRYFVAGISTGTNGVFPVYLFHLAVSPHIEINSPVSNQPYRLNAPFFSINIYNLSPLNTTWYTIDGGLTNYIFSGLAGFINQIAWDNEEDGVLTIRFYANDSLGNVGFKDVQVSKNPPMIDMFIPGYNLIFLLGILSFISIISVKKIRKF